MSTDTAFRNALADETSPYLLQHAHNPVEWYPWSAAALERACREDKPILLSIGYSACHWCHVMAHESFEDPATAEMMNTLFINIKVDREERPDLDKIYQLAHHVLVGRNGGWPLTVFLTPQDLLPYFAGTYFPRMPRYGIAPFTEVLRQAAGFYRERRHDIAEQSRELATMLQRLDAPEAPIGALSPAPLDIGRNQLAQIYDQEHGGFGAAPKFPHPTHNERLLRHWAATTFTAQADTDALAMAVTTLMRMADGGVYDQLGGGFFRYSVDAQWDIPHFEKMLYDNGALLALYGRAFQITRDPLLLRIVHETARWTMREMQAPDGGYYATLDADSEGEEGRFYCWTPDEVRAVLNEVEYPIVARRYGFDDQANFGTRWHLGVRAGLGELAETFALPPDDLLKIVDGARAKLFALRTQREHPGRDEKVIASWNGLMIKGMAGAGRVLNEPSYIASAQRALDFIRARLWHDGRLRSVYKDGRARFAAYLDDYAFLLDGVLELLQARWRDDDLHFAIALADGLLAHFEDHDHGGFFFTARDHEQLFYRPKPYPDEATPSGNGIAALALTRLGHLLGEPRYLDAAARTVTAAWNAITDLPYAHDTLLAALEEQLYPTQLVVLRGEPAALAPWQARLARHYAPRRYAVAIPSAAAALPGALAQRPGRGAVTAYLCSGTQCSAPITELTLFARELAGSEVATS